MDIELNLQSILSNYTQLTLFVVMLSMGMSVGLHRLLSLWRRPGLLVRCLVASFVVVPIAAMLINQVLPLSFAVKAGLALMAICPGSPMIYRKSLKGHANSDLAGGFQVTTALLAIVAVPIWLTIFAAIYPNDADFTAAAIFRQVAAAQLLPLVVGLALRGWLPELTAEFEPPVFKISSVLLLGLVGVILVVALPKILTAGIVPVVGASLFAAACLLAGHFLGGPTPEHRLTIALANTARNAGLALAIATANFRDPGILGAIATYALLAAIASKIYAQQYQK